MENLIQLTGKYPSVDYNWNVGIEQIKLTELGKVKEGYIRYVWDISRDGNLVYRTQAQTVSGQFGKYEQFAILDSNSDVLISEWIDLEVV